MSIYLNEELISGTGRHTVSNAHDLLDFKFTDHILNSISWLRSDLYTWNSGQVYTAVYQHLVADIGSKSPLTETISDITITYYLADDGHRICTSEQETNLQELYTRTGVAWYYLLDQDNIQFKLPRTKYAFSGFRDEAGKFIPESLPNIKGQNISEYSITTPSKCGGAVEMAQWTPHNYGGSAASAEWGSGWTFDASRSSSTYQDNASVQQNATQAYLYFYVGEFTQSAVTQSAGITAETLARKVDVGHQVIECKFPTASDPTWYRLYADGWVEQGGYITATSSSMQNTQITLPKVMKDTNYNVTLGTQRNGALSDGYGYYLGSVGTKTITTFGIYLDSTSYVTGCYWEAKGQVASS